MANDAREPAYDLPIPHPDNDIAEEFPRIGIAFTIVGAALDAFNTALAGKAATNHGHAIADVAGLVVALDGKAATDHNHSLDSLSDVVSAGASAGQVLAFGPSGWQPVTLNAASVGALPATAVSTFGASLTDDADAAEARATLELGSSALTSDDRVAYGNANSAIAGAARVAALTAALTAPRTWTLPAANAAGAPPYILIVDEVGGISATNTLTLAAGGGDTINGAATLVLTVPRSVVVLTRNGATRWTALQAAGAPNAAALPSSPVGALTANNVQAALEELDADLTAGLNSKLGTGHAGAGGAAHALATAVDAGFMSASHALQNANIATRGADNLMYGNTSAAVALAGLTAVDVVTNNHNDIHRVVITIDGASLPAAGTNFMLQIGDNSGIEATGYVGAGSTAGWLFGAFQSSHTDYIQGTIELLRVAGTDRWIMTGNIQGLTAANAVMIREQLIGSKTLGNRFGRIRLSRVGSGNIDAGNVTVRTYRGALT